VTTAPSALEGEGFPVRRAFAGMSMQDLDPFVHMDQMGEVDYTPGEPKGTPWHPHRGFETVTYMLAGSMEHKDHIGNHGVLGPGSVQWMTAGRGIVHSEMPRQEQGLLWGFQLWVNLPQSDKMCEPRYQDILASQIPVVQRPNGTVIRVIAGNVHGVAGPVGGIATDPTYLDIRLPADGTYDLLLTRGHAAFIYVYEGEGAVGGSKKEKGSSVGAGVLTVLGDGDVTHLVAGSDGMKLLAIAAAPLNEPVARYGPFVMNTRDEVRQAFEEFRAGTFLR